MRAFTLPEMLVTLALLTACASLSASIGSDSLARARSYHDLEQVLAVLRRARALAQAGACVSGVCSDAPDQGVYVDSSGATLFEGPLLTGSPHAEHFALSGGSRIGPGTVVFTARSGDAVADGDVSVVNGTGSYAVTVSAAGVIDAVRE